MAKAQKIVGIECDGPAADGIQPVLNSRLKEMCDLRSGALDWSDPEGVHDMRVASRRLRSALGDFSPYLRKRALTSTLKQTKEIADRLGEVRDQDVAIQALESLAEKTPPEVTEALKQVVSERLEIRDKARKDLTSLLRKTRLSQLESDFAAAIQSATSAPARSKQATKSALSYRRIARSIILERLKELEKLSNSLYRPLETDGLHEMRIAAKRLRYALELFEQCWGPELEKFAKKAAVLQTALGELHDCDVWIESFGERLIDAKKKGKEKSDASSWLLSHFLKLRTRHLRDALSRWCEWEEKGFSSELTRCLRDSSSSTSSRSSAEATSQRPGTETESEGSKRDSASTQQTA